MKRRVRSGLGALGSSAQRGIRAYGARMKRRRLLLRATRLRRDLTPLQDRTAAITPGDVLVFATVRNEMERLPHFMDHYRALGVGHFLFVDNASTDGTAAFVQDQSDASLWTTDASYKASRFGVDWINGLLMKHGHGHWCLTLDADELLVYPHHETRSLTALTQWLDREGLVSMQAMMLDMFPKGPVGIAPQTPNPLDHLQWFDAGNYGVQVQQPMHNLWIQGGPRARCFFADDPRRAPTMNKVPLVKWHWRYAYVNSTHAALPPKVNQSYARDGGEYISGALLHTKFLDTIIEKSAEEKDRRQHFNKAEAYGDYYDALTANPTLWDEQSVQYTGWQQLEDLGLISSGGWA